MKNIKISLLAFYDNKNKILLNQRRDGLNKNEDVWELVGGGIEDNESPIDAIKREISEELGYEVHDHNDQLEFSRQLNIRRETFIAEVHFFKAKFPGFHNFTDSSEVKVVDLKLFSIEEALSLNLLPICREILQNISTK